jgi:hypothetical protein
MATYQIVQRPNVGFFPGLSQSLPEASKSFAELSYAQKLKDQSAEKENQKSQAQVQEYLDALEGDGYEMDTTTINSEGKPSYRFKKRQTEADTFSADPAKAIKEALLGIREPESIGRTLGIEEPPPMGEDVASKFFPISQMTGRTPNVTGRPYGSIVKDALRDKFAGGATDAEIGRDYLGLPQAKEDEQKTYDPTTTETVKQNLKTSEDLDELLKNRKDYEDAGVDVIGILKGYLNAPQPDPGILQRIKKFFVDE